MTWKNKPAGKRKTKPNRLKSRPTISFRSNLSPETLGYVKKLALQKEKSRFINQAIEMKYFAETSPKQFLRQMTQHNYGFCKHLLRQIGRAFAVTGK